MSAHRENTAHESREFYKRNTDRRSAGFLCGSWKDFRFGYERKGTPAMLKEFGKKYGFHTEVLPKEMDGRRKISSTFVREELNRGNMEKFRFLMGTDFSVEGIVEHGRGMGHKYLLPTTNLIPPVEKLMPPNGVYITVSHFRDRSYQGITNVGHKPTVGGEKFIGVETYLFDCNEDLYGEYCKVDFKNSSDLNRSFLRWRH